MGKRKQKKDAGMARWISEVSECYVFIMLLIFPVFYNDNFIDIVRSKLAFYKVVTYTYLVIMAALFIALWVQKGRKVFWQDKPASWREALQRIPNDIRYVIVFIAAILISTLLSDYRAEAWFGTEGRRLGAMVMLAYLFVYLIISRFMTFKKWMVWIFLASNTIVILLGIFDFWGIDILNMYSNLSPSQYTMFISTVGNVNVNAGYLCLILPIAMVLYCVAEQKRMRIIYALFLWLGFLEGFATVSDSFFLGIGIAFLVMFWFCCSSNEWMIHFLDLCTVFFASCLMMRITYVIGIMRNVNGAFFVFYQELGLPNFLTSWYVLAAEIILIMLLRMAVVWTGKKGKELPYRIIRKIIFCVIGVVFAAAVIAVIAANCREEGTWTGSLSILNHLQLTDAFGSNRGYIWKRSLIVYGKLPWYQKIFGYGLNCFGKAVSVDYGTEMVELFNGVFIDAHNEVLQFLVTTGMIGVIGYFGIFASSVKYYAKRIAKSPVLLMGIAAVAGYMAQAMVNNPQTFITPSIFLFLGILKSVDMGELNDKV